MFSSPVPILVDSQIPDLVPMSVAIQQMERAFSLHAAGKLVAPARLSAELNQGHLMFTCGELLTEKPALGFRVYNWNANSSSQYAEMTPVYSAEDGELQGIILGTLFGAWRTGAIGGLALKYLADPQSRTLALIGSGLQARTQLLAASQVLPLEQVKIFSRNRQRCQKISKRFQHEVRQTALADINIEAVDSVKEAVTDAEVVVTATTSSEPLLKPAWLQEKVHLQNIGPKFKNSHEIPLEVIQNCETLATDARLQAEEYGAEYLLSGTAEMQRMVSLSELVKEGRVQSTASKRDGASYFCSLGLAGTEIVLADSLFRLIKPD